MDQDADYHRQRAQAEMDLADRAAQAEVADAHAQLPALHMLKLEALETPAAGDAAPAVREGQRTRLSVAFN